MKKKRYGYAGTLLAACLALSCLGVGAGELDLETLSQEASWESEEALFGGEVGLFEEEEAVSEEVAEDTLEEQAPFTGGELFQESSSVMVEESLFSSQEGEAAQEEAGDFTGEDKLVGAVTSGSCGENVRWSYQGGTLTISGSGPMKDFNPNDGRPQWFAYANELTSVVVGGEVTELGDYSFAECTALSQVSLGEDLEVVGDWAFRGCSSLKSIQIPDKVITIGYQGFYNCEGLETVKMGHRVISIYEYCFLDCASLRTIYLPKELSNVEYAAFDGCDQLKDVYYEGSEADWAKVFIKNNNEPLARASIHYNYESVTPTPVPSLTLDHTKETLYVGYSKKLTLTPTLTNLTNQVSFTSSNPSVASVSKTGVVRALKKGTAQITASVSQYGGTFEASCKVTVKKPSLSAPSTLTLKVGETLSLEVSPKPDGVVIYSSQDPKVATVTAYGDVTAVKKGSTKIKVQCNGLTRKVKVTVK